MARTLLLFHYRARAAYSIVSSLPNHFSPAPFPNFPPDLLTLFFFFDQRVSSPELTASFASISRISLRTAMGIRGRLSCWVFVDFPDCELRSPTLWPELPLLVMDCREEGI